MEGGLRNRGWKLDPAWSGVLELIEVTSGAVKGVTTGERTGVTSVRTGFVTGAATWVSDFAARPPRQAGVIVKDDGDGGTKAAGFLAERKFI